MASTLTNTVILKEPSHWKRWYEDLRSGIEREIWEIIDPQGPIIAPIARPSFPTFQQYNLQAQTYADLNVTQKKDYDNAMKHFDTHLRVYTNQQSKLAIAREKIHITVSDQKKAVLKASETTKEWLAKLIANTKPTDQEIQLQAKLRYTNAIRPSRSVASIPAWIDEWETAMAEGIDADIPETKSQITWLKDFCTATEQLVPDVSKHFMVLLIQKKPTPLDYNEVS